MPNPRMRIRLMLAVVLTAMLSALQAEDAVKDLLSQANKELRNSQNAMFNGKHAESKTALEKVARLIEQIEKADPDSAQLASLKSKYDKQKKDLERRMGDGPSEKPKEDGKEVQGQSTRPLPRDVQEKKRPFDNAVRQIEAKVRWAENAKDGSASKPPVAYATEAEELLPALKAAFDELKAEAEKAGVSDHSDLAAAQKIATELPEQVRKLKSETQKAAADQEAATKEAEADLAKLKSEADRLRDRVFNQASGTAMHYNDLEPVRELLAVIRDFEKNDAAAAQELVDAFKAKYGADMDAIQQKVGERVYALETLSDGITNVAKTRVALSEDLVRRAESQVEALEQIHDFARLDRHAAIREHLDLAAEFDAKPVEAAGPRIGDALTADAKKLDEKIAKAKWPGHADNAPSDLEKTAFNWLKNDPGWGKNPKAKYAVLAVAIRGPWNVQERNVLGQPTMHGLPILLAVQRPEDKPAKFVRCFLLTACTVERAGVQAAPPFHSVRVGNSYLMKMENLPAKYRPKD